MTLTIVSDEATNLSNFCLYTVKQNWLENQATWNAYSTGNNWQTAGAGGANDIDTTAIACLSFGRDDPYGTQKVWSLPTSVLQAMLDGSAPNYGFLIRSGEGEDKYQFASSDNATASFRPKLVVEYTTAVPAPVPTPEWSNVSYSYTDADHVHAVTGLLEREQLFLRRKRQHDLPRRGREDLRSVV